jgi:hypothetical protein
MRITDLINEGKWASDFQRYRQMGQKPTELIKHAADKVIGSSPNKSTTPRRSASVRNKNTLGDTSEIKSIIDQVIGGQQLDSQSLQTLKQFRRKL